MNVRKFTVVLAFLFVSLFVGTFTGVGADGIQGEIGTVGVHITGLRSDKGVVRFLLFNDEADYLKDRFTGDRAYKIGTARIKNTESVYVFRNIPYGEYALKFFHDEDKSGTMPKSRFGGSKAQFGYSNNARGRFGPPNFELAKFSLQGSEIYMNIESSK